MNDENFIVFNYQLPKPKEEVEISIRSNQKFEIVIDGNLTTGYNWVLANGNESNLLVKPLNLCENNTGEYFKKNHPPGWCGGGGALHFKFEPIKVGVQELKFVYKRSWNNEVAAELNTRVTITDS